MVPVIPNQEEFPYTIRVVSEVLSSNGSTSQASICGSTLALMDAGVPIKEPVAGISTGLVTDSENPDNYIMLTDIQGLEDFFGDMDFKVGGTKNGITAIQVDIKVDGLSYKIIEEAFARTRKARQYILDEVMLKQIAEPRKEVSKYAPKILTMKIKPEKIKDVIGTGGKTINKIIEETGVKIDISEEGNVVVYSVDKEAAQKAIDKIENIDYFLNTKYLPENLINKYKLWKSDIEEKRPDYIELSRKYNEQLEVIQDGLESIYITITKTIIIFIIAYFLGLAKELIILLIFYNLIRATAFGLHATKSSYCLISSTLIFIGTAYLCKLLIIPFYIKILLCIINILLIYKWSPADTEKRPIVSKKRREIYKTLSTIIAITFSFISILTFKLINNRQI